jgi:uncharacterized protein (DUF4415 family)
MRSLNNQDSIIGELQLLDILPASLQNKLSALPKESVTVQFDRDLLATFKATGGDWQTRINDALREWLSEHAI